MLSRLYRTGEDQPKPAQFAVLAKIVNLLRHDTLSMQDAALYTANHRHLASLCTLLGKPLYFPANDVTITAQ